MATKIIYSPIEVEDAASFLAKNNPHFINQFDHIKNTILLYLYRLSITNYIDPYTQRSCDITYISTMGFTIVAYLRSKENFDSDTNIIGASITVTPTWKE